MDANQITTAVRAYFAQRQITMGQVAERLGVTPSAVTNQLSGRPFSAKMARRYAEEFGFSFDFLLKGDGSLFDTEEITSIPEHTVPLVPFSVRGGATLHDVFSGVTEAECERITSPVRGAELATEVVGDSMAPAFPAGARVLLKRVKNTIAWGEAYVLDTTDGQMLKRILPTEDEDVWELRSDNPDYPPFKVRREHVRSVWRVLLRMIQ